jgi:mRNA-degrading endonuclease RelE of RelBE toxin-antitoxin system
MKKRPPYRIEFTPEADDHFAKLTARDRSILADAIERQLVHQPGVATRNRGPMEPNPVAQYRLRVGEMAVYYDVGGAERVVKVKAIGIKDRDRVFVGAKEIKL